MENEGTDFGGHGAGGESKNAVEEKVERHAVVGEGTNEHDDRLVSDPQGDERLEGDDAEVDTDEEREGTGDPSTGSRCDGGRDESDGIERERHEDEGLATSRLTRRAKTIAEGDRGDEHDASDSSSQIDPVGSENELGEPGNSGDENSGELSSR